MGELGREIMGGGSHTDTPEVSLVVTPQRAQKRKSVFPFLKALKTLKKKSLRLTGKILLFILKLKFCSSNLFAVSW